MLLKYLVHVAIVPVWLCAWLLGCSQYMYIVFCCTCSNWRTRFLVDNGPSFVSQEFEEFLRRNGIKHKTTDPYHPTSNGLAERAVQIFKKGIRKMQTGALQAKIARFLFSYRNTPQSTTDTAPAQLLMGCKLRSPLDLLKPDLQGRVEREQEHQKQSHDQHSRVYSFQL